jgi:hypothetical protein
VFARILGFALVIGFSLQSFAETRTFQCKLSNDYFSEKNQKVETRDVEVSFSFSSDDILKKAVVGTLLIKIDGFEFPGMPAGGDVNAEGSGITVAGGEIKAVKVYELLGSSKKRAFMGQLKGDENAVLFDMTASLSGGKTLPAECGELKSVK